MRGMQVTGRAHRAVADGAPARRARPRACCRRRLEEKGMKFLLQKQTAELVRGESGRVAAMQVQGRRFESRPIWW
ncbi:MAG: hypothetical protein MZW92_14800 [Comamonadaceae bacterium]|nr:hypothetical protein [Comamonadaceae bacterium]